jgi:hypothetical protein
MSRESIQYAAVRCYFDFRAEQFASLEEAYRAFKSKEPEQSMWASLFEYAIYKEAADSVFDEMSHETMCVLAQNHGVKIIVSVVDEEMCFDLMTRASHESSMK